jgi:hypothetical protein
MSLLQLLLLAIFIASCGKTQNNKSQNKIIYNNHESIQDMHGIYQALLRPVNKKLTPDLNGALTLARNHDEFIADVRFAFGPKGVVHEQNIHLGERCPDDNDDLNSDGYIDHEEGSKVFNKIIIPLDDDLNLQRMGSGTFPISDNFGHYIWSRLASFEKLLLDLYDEDLNSEDAIAKLYNGSHFSLINKVIIIKGIEETVLLPESVKGNGIRSAQQLLPIACGKIVELKSVPQNHYNENHFPSSGSNPDDGAHFKIDPDDNNYGED